MNIGIVFEGGGAKGAYQVGAWKAIRELGIERYVKCVSGTSVGALNAVLFYMGSLSVAEELWKGLTDDDILHEKKVDIFEDGDCFFSNKRLEEMIDIAIRSSTKRETCSKCYVTCRYRDRNEYRYFKWSDFRDAELKKRVLLASSAIPFFFPGINIDGEWYVDGGANGDNIPVKPLEKEKLDYIIVIHLSNMPARLTSFKGTLIEIFPSEDLGGFIDGTIDFDPKSIMKRILTGYEDTKKALMVLGDECCKLNINIQNNTEQIKFEKVTVNYLEDKEMVDFKFTSDEARQKYEDKIAELERIKSIKEIDNAFLWDQTVQKYATKMIKVREALKSDGISDLITAKMFKDIDNFLKRCSDAEYHIALVGTIKAGKSTLINALLGYEYASTKVTPETAALTKFKKGEKNSVKVSFYSVNEWDELWKDANDAKAAVFLEEYAKLDADSEKDKWLGKKEENFDCGTKEELVAEIKKWTSSKSACHYFVKEVEVSLKDFEFDQGVVFVDTPGLDDAIEYRSNITRDYIDRANAVLVCVKSDALGGPELATIYSVFANTRYNPGKVYIIATQIDALNRPKENWQEQQQEWLKHLKEKGAYASRELASRNLIPVSAYLYTLLKDYDHLDQDDDRYWDLNAILLKFRVKNVNERYKEMLDYTNIALLKNRIEKEFVQDYKKLLIEDIIGSYDLCKDSIKEAMEKIKTVQEEIIHTSQGGIEEIREKQAEYNLKYEQAEADKKELDTLLKRLQKATTQRADQLENAIMSLAE